MFPEWMSVAACKTTLVLTEEEIEDLPNKLPENIQIANTKRMHQLFFPERNDQRPGEIAMSICDTCPVQLKCLKYALDTSQRDGVWGGTSGRTRRRIRRMRRIYQLSGKFVVEDDQEKEEIPQILG